MLATLGTIYLIIILLLVVLVICWIILPVAIIGTKPLLRQLLAESRRTNALLEELRRESPPGIPMRR
jgi:hypothetical protein